jgi:hypothetical protein
MLKNNTAIFREASVINKDAGNIAAAMPRGIFLDASSEKVSLQQITAQPSSYKTSCPCKSIGYPGIGSNSFYIQPSYIIEVLGKPEYEKIPSCIRKKFDG